ncbi:prepronociceptin-like [Myxocyprinus asiaticus]|uniref:prepronociceptin-like n=1 Tax=Myxocyprinus asiaticus TaxID=70543 RepID=UPI0022230F63|nr:prepronociceptin-like [Myxocyprinus asiaticus]
MKTPLWTLLLLGLCNPVWCDCQKDCLFCSQQLPKEFAFTNLVCLVECHGKLSPGNSWELCRRTIVEQKPKASFPIEAAILKRADEETDTFLPVDENDPHYSENLKRFDHVTRAVGAEDQDQDQNMQLSKKYKFLQVQSTQESEEEQNEDSEMEGNEEEAAIQLIKRFGGFLKNKYGYRKFMDPRRSLQKRYGGFIGVRKSARKWNNQKRFSDFLKQYLGMSTRASENE